MNNRRNRRGLHTAAAAIPLFLAFSLFALWPLGTSSQLYDHTDTVFNSWLIQWNIHALSSGESPLNLPMFSGFPDGNNLNERLLTQSVPAALLKLLSLNQFLTHNLLLVLFLSIAGYAAALLTAETEGSGSAAVFAGTAVVLLPWFQSHIGHLQLFSAGLSILAISFSIRFVRGKSSGWPVIIFVLAQSLASMDLWFFMNIALLLLLPFLFGKETRRKVPGLLGFWAAGNAIGILLIFNYFQSTSTTVTDAFAVTDVAAYLAPWKTSVLLSWMRSVHVSGETALWPGLASAAGVIWFMYRGKVNWMDRYLLLCSLVFALLSLGSTLVFFGGEVCPAPFRLIMGLPGASSITSPAHGAIFALFPMAVLAGKVLSRNTLLVILGIIVSAVGVYHNPLETMAVDEQPWHQWLAEREFDKVLYLPVVTDASSPETEALRLSGSVLHFTPSVNGYSSTLPQDYAHTAMVLNSWPSPEALRMVEAFGVHCIMLEGWQPFNSDTVFTYGGRTVAAIVVSGN